MAMVIHNTFFFLGSLFSFSLVLIAFVSPAAESMYISYGIESFWIQNEDSVPLHSPSRIPIGFDFTFYGRTYNALYFSPFGYLSFTNGEPVPFPTSAPTFSGDLETGESIWLWWTQYAVNMTEDVVSYGAVTVDNGTVFVLSILDGKLLTGSDDLSFDTFCSETITAQVRIYQSEQQIEIDIFQAPIFAHQFFFSGIYSDLHNHSILLLPPVEELSESIHDSLFQCPYPIAGRFLSAPCISDQDCRYPPSDIGYCYGIEPKCKDTTCQQPNILGVPVTNRIPSYTPLQWCETDLSCCIYHYPLFYELPASVVDDNHLSEACQLEVKLSVCDLCKTFPLSVEKKQDIFSPAVYLVLNFHLSQCSVQNLIGDEISDLTGFPIRPVQNVFIYRESSGDIYHQFLDTYIAIDAYEFKICPSDLQQSYIRIQTMNQDIPYGNSFYYAELGDEPAYELDEVFGLSTDWNGCASFYYTVIAPGGLFHLRYYSIVTELPVVIGNSDGYVLADVDSEVVLTVVNTVPLEYKENHFWIRRCFPPFLANHSSLYTIEDCTFTNLLSNLKLALNQIEGGDYRLDGFYDYTIYSIEHNKYLGYNNHTITLEDTPTVSWNITEAVVPVDCDTTTIEIGLSGVQRGYISDGPLMYTQNRYSDDVSTCVRKWIFKVPDGMLVRLILEDLDLSSSDTVRISNVDFIDMHTIPISHSLTGNSHVIGSEISFVTSFTITFSAFGRGERRGFLIRYKSFGMDLCRQMPFTLIDSLRSTYRETIGGSTNIKIPCLNASQSDWIAPPSGVLPNDCSGDISLSQGKEIYIILFQINREVFITNSTEVHGNNEMRILLVQGSKFSFKIPRITGTVSYMTVFSPEYCQSTFPCYTDLNNNVFYYCPSGYQRKNRTCIDINECELGCCYRGICKNTQGSFDCTCQGGDNLSVGSSCEATNECSENTHMCDPHAECVKLDRSYKCVCKSGYVLSKDKRTCTYHFPKVSEENSFSYQNFCSPFTLQSLNYNGTLRTVGCMAQNLLDASQISPCIFPFRFGGKTYNTCIRKVVDTFELSSPWCAINVNPNGDILAIGLCLCSTQNTNVALEGVSLGKRSDALFLTDGIQDPNFAALLTPQDDPMKIFFKMQQKIRMITLHGSSKNIQTKPTNISLHFFRNVNDANPAHQLVRRLDNNFTTDVIYLPSMMHIMSAIGIASDTDLYLEEIKAYEYVMRFSDHDLSFTDCGLKLDSNLEFIEHNTTITPDVLSFATTFSFKLIRRPTFAFYLRSAVDKSIKLQLLFEPKTRLVSLVSDSNLLYRTKNVSIFTDGTDNYCSLRYSENHLDVTLNQEQVISSDINLEDWFPSDIIFGFELLRPSTLKRDSSPSDSYVHLSWWHFDDQTKTEAIVDSIVLVIILCVATAGVIIIVVIVSAICCRETDQTVESLPPFVRRHRDHFNHFPIAWKLKGDKNSAFVYIRKLPKRSKTRKSLTEMWEQMGGRKELIDKAYAIHNPLLLRAFGTKYTFINTQNIVQKTWEPLPDPHQLRKAAYEQYMKIVERYPWNSPTTVAKIIPTIHGTNPKAAASIIQSGFLALAKLDSGYYGKGIYFTSSVKYALPYFVQGGIVLLNLVISGNAYPVIEHPQDPENFLGKALRPGYHSHYVMTTIDGLPVRNLKDDKFYDEIIIEQESCILPFFMVKIDKGELAIESKNLIQEKKEMMDRITRQEKASFVTTEKVDTDEETEDDEVDTQTSEPQEYTSLLSGVLQSFSTQTEQSAEDVHYELQ